MKLVSEQEPLFIFINRPFHLIDKRFKGWIFSIITILRAKRNDLSFTTLANYPGFIVAQVDWYQRFFTEWLF